MKKYLFLLLGIFVCHAAVGVSCEPGYGLNELNECEICSAGHFSPGGDDVLCAACPAGKYSDETGATECKTCPKGMFSEGEGWTQCEYCAPGTYHNASGLTGQHQCIGCHMGSCCVYGQEYKCVKGTYASYGGQACKMLLENTQTQNVCTRGGGTCSLVLVDMSVYQKGLCEETCAPGCTTAGVGSISNTDCTVKTVNTFCAGNKCFSWPKDGSLYEQDLNGSVISNVTCP